MKFSTIHRGAVPLGATLLFGCSTTVATPASGPIEPRAGTTTEEVRMYPPTPSPAAGAVESDLTPYERAVDSRILGVLDAACGKLDAQALVGFRQATDDDVRELAGDIHAECSRLMQDQQELVQSTGLGLADSQVRARFQNSTWDAVSELSATRPSRFDRVFLDRMIEDLESALATVDGTLAETANHDRVEELIDDQYVPMLRTNLERARDLREDLVD